MTKKTSEISRKYRMDYRCGNCGREFTQTFEFGEKASQGVCPHCGVSPNQDRWETRY